MDGVLCDQVLVRLRPGLGAADEDRVLLAIGQRRPPAAPGAVLAGRLSQDPRGDGGRDLSEHVEYAGLWWPTAYLERVRYPIDRDVHRWTLTGLDVNRGLTAEDLRGRPSERARRPAAGA